MGSLITNTPHLLVGVLKQNNMSFATIPTSELAILKEKAAKYDKLQLELKDEVLESVGQAAIDKHNSIQ